ncbi:Aste57867_11397 [Aphanomyces stellatus]|uniref:Aste57867_11397 protein n=1 Tax=Aphanomyces stellatus TaxID=120398 RepID=A0A485KSV5_9STRA|nr:hypothetical protein As57867_011355 [Aphanomyces stellatus]VFT88258.1 Aste57867_11397 [Aphanomyces stellatus]
MRDYFADMFGGVGLLSSEDGIHDHQRKTLNPHFKIPHVKTSLGVFYAQALRCCHNVLDPAAATKSPLVLNTGPSSSSTSTNMNIVLRQLTLNVIGLSAFGYDFDANTAALQAYADMVMPPNHLMLLAASSIPGFLSLPLPFLRRRKRARATLMALLGDVIKAKNVKPQDEKDTGQDLLDLMLEFNVDSHDAMVHTLTFMWAGHETASAALSWIFYMLSSHPIMAARVRDECTAALRHFGAFDTWEAISELVYTTAFIQETLRMHPPIPIISRRTPWTTGTDVIAIPAAMHRNPLYWTRADEFLPDRYLEGTMLYAPDATRRGGTKACIGKHFVLAELQVVVGTVVSKYHFDVTNEANCNPKYNGATAQPTKLDVTIQRVEDQPRFTLQFNMSLIVGVGVAIVVGAFGVVYFLVFKPLFSPLNHLPGPKPTSLMMGNAAEFNTAMAEWRTKGGFAEPYYSWMRTFGGIVHYRLVVLEMVLVTDPKAVQNIIVANAANFPRHPSSRNFFKEMFSGVGLLSSEGSMHNRQRQVLKHHFSMSQVKTSLGVFRALALRCCNTVMDLAVDSQTRIQVNSVFQQLTLSAIGLSVFGYDFQTNEAAHKAYTDMNFPPNVLLFLATQAMPWLTSLPIESFQRRERARMSLFDIMSGIIKAKLESDHDPAKPRDLLDLMLESKVDSHEAIVHTLTLLWAGHETTSAALCWVFYFLATKPSMAAQVRRECQAVLKKFGSFDEWEAIAELKYTTAFIQETLRLYPVVPDLTRRTVAQNCSIPMSDGSFAFLPKDTTVLVGTCAMHRDPQYWTQADEFEPERFIEGTSVNLKDQKLRGGKSHTFNFMPFSFGSKNCIGQRFAMAEMQILLATLVSNYEFALAADANCKPSYFGTVVLPINLAMRVRHAGRQLTHANKSTLGTFPEPYKSWVREYGGAVFYRLGFLKLILVTDPQALHFIFVTQGNHFPRAQGIHLYFADMFAGVGLLSSEGAVHDHQRKTLNPHFSHVHVKASLGIFYAQALRCCRDILDPAVASQAPLHMTSVFHKLALNAIGLSAFGHDFDADEAALIAYADFCMPQNHLLFVGASTIPGFTSLPFPSFRRRNRARATLVGIMEAIIDAKLKAKRASDGEHLRDMLDLMLEANMPRHEAIVHTMTLMFAGHDTTAAALSWVTLMLASHPSVAARVREESRAVCRELGALGKWDALMRLPFTTAVIQETLRLHPPVPVMSRRTALATCDMPMSDGSTITVPKGMHVIVMPSVMHRNPLYWTDPDTFLPDRFLADSLLFAQDAALRGGQSHAMYFMPFSFGAKNCLGQRFAMAELQVVVATLASKYEFAVTGDTNGNHKYNGSTVQPANLDMTIRCVDE